MPERFVCPEPSEAAWNAIALHIPSAANGNRSALHEAMCVDVPAIVKAEVERFVADICVEYEGFEFNPDSVRRHLLIYTASRFPEAASETKEHL